LVCLFAFIFTPLAIHFGATTYDWKQLAEEYRQVAETALAREKNAVAVTLSEIQHYKNLLDVEYNRRMENLQRIANQDKKIDELTLERDQLNRSKDNWETSARLLTAQLAVQGKHNQELNETKENLLARERELEAVNINITEQLKRQRAESEVLKEEIYQLKEMVAFQEKENEKLRMQFQIGKAAQVPFSTPTPTAEAAAPATISPINGSVTEVRGRMASIDVGESSGVRKGMTMVVLRDSNYVCDLVITSVAPHEAAGEVNLELMGGRRIRPSDRVMDLNSFQSRN